MLTCYCTKQTVVETSLFSNMEEKSLRFKIVFIDNKDQKGARTRHSYISDILNIYVLKGRADVKKSICQLTLPVFVFPGADEESARQPCWSLGICVLPAVLVLCVFVIIVGFCLCSGVWLCVCRLFLLLLLSL